jgi:hypothetical protein
VREISSCILTPPTQLLTIGDGDCVDEASAAKRQLGTFTGQQPDQLIVRANVTVTPINRLEASSVARRV